jgi:hypothetical protein
MTGKLRLWAAHGGQSVGRRELVQGAGLAIAALTLGSVGFSHDQTRSAAIGRTDLEPLVYSGYRSDRPLDAPCKKLTRPYRSRDTTSASAG